MITSLFLVLQTSIPKYVFLASSPEPTNMLDVRAILWLENYLQVSLGKALQWVWRESASKTPGASYPSKQPVVLLFLRRGPPQS